MKRLVVFTALALATAAHSVAAQGVYHQGHTNQNGTYVEPYYSSQPDRSYNNNWGVSPNVNPYTDRQGTLSPTMNDRAPSSSPYAAPSYQSPAYNNPYQSNRRR